MWLNVGTLALNDININNISKILIDNRYKCNIIPKNHTGYYFHKIVNDPLTIIILQHYFKSNESEENKFIQYIGLIGSEIKWSRFKKRLLEVGIPLDKLSNIKCPIGFNIGGKSPKEVSISLAAELIELYYKNQS